MARMLYRLGHASARRPFVVLTAWLLVLLAAGGAMVGLQRPLTNTFSLPGSQFQRVLDELGREVPAVAGGTGTVVFTTDAQGFTEHRREAIEKVFASWERAPHVRSVVNPFTTQRTMNVLGARLRAGKSRLDAGESKYAHGVHKVQQLRWLIDQNAKAISRLRRTDPTSAELVNRLRGQAQGMRMLSNAERRLASARSRLDSGQMRYQTSRALYDDGAGFRMVSANGRAALAQVRFDVAAQSVPVADRNRLVRLGKALAGTGVHVDYGQEIVNVTEPGGVSEIIGIVVAAIVLLVMLGAWLAGLPLLLAFVGVGSSLMTGMAATHFFTLHQLAPVLGAMLGLAVGIDYSLFIANRHRKRMADIGRAATLEQTRHSIGMAMGTSGSAVVVAGSTVIIALGALTVSAIPILVQMGLLAAMTVAFTVLVSVTLTPALLSLVGVRAVPKATRGRAQSQRTLADRWVVWVTSHGRIAVSLVALGLLVVALPTLSLRLGLPDGGSDEHSTTSYRAYTQVERAFGPGANGTILVAAHLDRPSYGQRLQQRELDVASVIRSEPGVRAVLPIGTSRDHSTVAMQVVPQQGPSSALTVQAVDSIRGDASRQLASQGIHLGTTGQAAANIEVSQRLAGALPLYLALVVGLSLLLLTVVFRSVVVPLLATGGFLLSVAASFGAVVAVYQWGWVGHYLGVTSPGAILSFMPTLLIGILFGLAMDYQMFLVSGMREAYTHGQSALASVTEGFAAGARVVTAAAVIMISVFAGFMFSGMTMIRPIGFGLAVGVLVDAFLIRMTLIPAAMALLGDRAWWMPVWLGRVLPHLDVEGTSLVEESRAQASAGAQAGRERQVEHVG